MALVDNAWYVNYGNGSSTGYYAVAQFAASHTYAAGAIIRQLTAPSVGSERCFVCTTAGTSGTEPTWTNTRGALNTSTTAIFQECTGIAALNGDATNTPLWSNAGIKNNAITLGQVIARVSGTSYQICTVAGTAGNGSEPSFSDTAGTVTSDGATLKWTSLGVVGNFTGWQAPHARLGNAFASTWGQPNNKFFVGDNHAETQNTGSNTLTSPGASATPNFIYCVDHTASVPPGSANLATTATITAVLNGTALNLVGDMYIYGITFVGGGNSGNPVTLATGASSIRLDSCQLKLSSNTSGLKIQFAVSSGSGCSLIYLTNTTFSFANAGQSIYLGSCIMLWENTPSAIAGTAPTTLIPNNAYSGASLQCNGVDLSAIASGSTIIGPIDGPVNVSLQNCKIASGVTVAAASPKRGDVRTDLVSSDSSGTNYRHERYRYDGKQTVEATIIRTGGASNGTTGISWNITTTANSKWVFPFGSFPISIWNTSTSAITTLTIYGTTTGGGVPNNDDIWVEVEYLGSSSTPQGSFITTTKANNLAASTTTNNSSDASTWGGGGAGNGFKIVVPSFTPGMAGPINITVKVAKASSTYYIDPRPAISGVTVAKSEILAPGIYVNELSSGAVQYRANIGGNV